MGDCQLRNGLGQTRHMYLVFPPHSVLMRQLRQSRAGDWALERLMTVGQACRAVLRQTLGQTIAWVVEGCPRRLGLRDNQGPFGTIMTVQKVIV